MLAQSAAAQNRESCAPVETRAPNARGQQPQFAGQTRACETKSDVAFLVAVLTDGLERPWAVEPLPGGDLLVTEKPGRLRIVSAKGSIARGVLSPERRSLEEVRVIFRAMPTYDNHMHFGSRLAFGPDGMLYVTTGERSDRRMRKYAQDPASHLGKVVQLAPDGSKSQVWSLGHRNLQAAAFDAQGRLWTVEHGPRGGDELNLIEKGKNYGWPLVSYGEEYYGLPIAGAKTARPRYQQPVYYWDPVIAPSGAQFYTGELFPEWLGDLFIGGLQAEALVRLELREGRVVGEEHLLEERGARVRDVRQGPDGALYVVTDEGELWKLTTWGSAARRPRARE